MNNIEDLQQRVETLKKVEKTIEKGTNKALESTFEVDEDDNIDYKKLQNIYIEFTNITPQDSFLKFSSLLTKYIETYKNSNKNIQMIFEGKLEKLFSTTPHFNMILSQIKREGGLLAYGERRLGIK